MPKINFLSLTVQSKRYVGQMSLSKSLGQNFSHDLKDLMTRNVHVKYESSISNGSKVKTNVKVFRNVGQRSQSISQGHRPWFQLKGFIS